MQWGKTKEQLWEPSWVEEWDCQGYMSALMSVMSKAKALDSQVYTSERARVQLSATVRVETKAQEWVYLEDMWELPLVMKLGLMTVD